MADAAGARLSDLDQTFAALADPTRRQIIGLLRAAPRRSGDLAEELATSRPAMSRHLRVLRRAGLVEERAPEADARAREYRLRRRPFTDLRDWLDEVESFWGDQLAAFKAHAERTRRRR